MNDFLSSEYLLDIETSLKYGKLPPLWLVTVQNYRPGQLGPKYYRPFITTTMIVTADTVGNDTNLKKAYRREPWCL